MYVTASPACYFTMVLLMGLCYHGRSQEFDLGGYKCYLSWVNETKQPHKKFGRLIWAGGIYTDIPPVATPLSVTVRLLGLRRKHFNM